MQKRNLFKFRFLCNDNKYDFFNFVFICDLLSL